MVGSFHTHRDPYRHYCELTSFDSQYNCTYYSGHAGPCSWEQEKNMDAEDWMNVTFKFTIRVFGKPSKLFLTQQRIKQLLEVGLHKGVHSADEDDLGIDVQMEVS